MNRTNRFHSEGCASRSCYASPTGQRNVCRHCGHWYHRFGQAIADFEKRLDELYLAAKEVGEVTDHDGVALVDTKGFENSSVKTTLTEITDMVSEWRGARRRATRTRADLDDSGEVR